MRVGSLLCLWIGVGGCFDPHPQPGSPCPCPNGLVCDQGVCVVPSDGSATPDAASSIDGVIDGAITGPEAGACAAPFVASSFGCHAFLTSNTRTYDTARAECVALGADLTIVTSTAEASYVGAMGAPTSSDRAWLGLTRVDASAPWLWVDGSTATYFNWSTGEPNESLPCAASKPDGTWGDRRCDELYFAVCEK